MVISRVWSFSSTIRFVRKYQHVNKRNKLIDDDDLKVGEHEWEHVWQILWTK